MVAIAYNTYFIIVRSSIGRHYQFFDITLYLHDVLIMDRTDSYKTLVSISTALLVLYLKTRNELLIYTTLILFLFSLFSLELYTRLFQLFRLLFKAIGLKVSAVVLGLVYFLFLVPTAFLYRILNPESYEFFYKDTRSSYFDPPFFDHASENLEKLW